MIGKTAVIGRGGTTSRDGGVGGGWSRMIMMATKMRRIGQGAQSRVLGLSWAQHRLRVLIRLSHVKNCPFFLSQVEFLLFEILFLYLNCVGKEIRERKTRLSRFEFAFVLFVLCVCAIGDEVLHCSHETSTVFASNLSSSGQPCCFALCR